MTWERRDGLLKETASVGGWERVKRKLGPCGHVSFGEVKWEITYGRKRGNMRQQ